MKKVLNKSALILATLSLPFAVHASDSQYVPGLEGIKASVAPPPGVYYRGYIANYSADKNEALPDDSKVSATALVNRAIWVTPQKFLGGDVILDAIVPLVNTDIDVGGQNIGERTGLASSYASGLIAWHGMAIDGTQSLVWVTTLTRLAITMKIELQVLVEAMILFHSPSVATLN